MARTAPLRIGIVGLGMGRAHARAAATLPGIELAAIAEPKHDRIAGLQQWIGETLGAKALAQARRAQLFDDYQTMAREGGLDAMVLALPTDMHASASAYCLRQGVHVLCEKPPTVRPAEMVRVARLARDRGLTYMFCRQQRFDPRKFATRELATGGRLGTVYHAESKWMRSRGVPFRGGWGVNRDTGGGVLLDLGIHKLDDAWFCMGSPKPVAAFCGAHCGMPHLAQGKGLSLPYDADDATFGMIRFETGASLSFATTFALNEVHHDVLHDDAVVKRSEWNELKIHGSKAGVDVQHGRLITDHRQGVQVSPLRVPARLAKMKTQIEGQLADFARAVRSGEDSLNPPEQAVQLMQMLDALRRSGETGRSVTIR